MKSASPALQSLILSGQFSVWHLYQIALTNGSTLYLTNADFDIWDANGNLYSSGSYGSRLPKIDAKSARVTSMWASRSLTARRCSTRSLSSTWPTRSCSAMT